MGSPPADAEWFEPIFSSMLIDLAGTVVEILKICD